MFAAVGGVRYYWGIKNLYERNELVRSTSMTTTSHYYCSHQKPRLMNDDLFQEMPDL